MNTPLNCGVLSGRRWTLYVNEQGSIEHSWRSGVTIVDVVPAADLERALAALKETDSWLWNKVVHGRFGEPDGEDELR